jgi:hypothetical protein
MRQIDSYSHILPRPYFDRMAELAKDKGAIAHKALFPQAAAPRTSRATSPARSPPTRGSFATPTSRSNDLRRPYLAERGSAR